MCLLYWPSGGCYLIETVFKYVGTVNTATLVSFLDGNSATRKCKAISYSRRPELNTNYSI